MNKTAILSFIIDEVALKCRNVSSNMRKRIHWMLEEKEIILKEYDERALILIGWVRVGKEGIKIVKLDEMKKGLSNYRLKTQEHLDKLLTLNNEVRCFDLDIELIDSIEIESIEKLSISSNNYKIYSKYSFSVAKEVSLFDLSTDQIKFVLTRFKRIVRLEIYSSSLENIDFGLFRIKEIFFRWVSFKKTVYLPKEITKLTLLCCESINLIKAYRVTAIKFSNHTDNSLEWETLFNSLEGVRIVEIDRLLAQCLPYFPSTVRRICSRGLSCEADKLEKIMKQFPYLVDFEAELPIEVLEKTKLRVIDPLMIETEEKFKLRPRKITVTSENADELNDHPELFEKVESVDINAYEFNFDVLPSEIKKIAIQNEVNLESITLNRFEKERK